MSFPRFLLILCCLGSSSISFAEEKPGLHLELNKLEQRGQHCAFYLVFQNQLSSPFRELQLELVFFDQDGLIQQRLLLNAAPLAARKTTVKFFQVPNTPCTSVGRVLVNDIPECQPFRESCLDLLSVSSRSKVALIK